MILHYPTDINLLFDAMRKVIVLIARLCMEVGISEWRQSSHNIRMIKKLYRKAQEIKHSRSRDEKKREERDELIIGALRPGDRRNRAKYFKKTGFSVRHYIAKLLLNLDSNFIDNNFLRC